MYNIKLTNSMIFGIVGIIAATIALVVIGQDRARLAKIEAEKAKVEEQRAYEQKIEDQRETKLQICLIQEDLKHVEVWNAECDSRGLESNCSLPMENAKHLEKLRENGKDTCLKIYK
jgi:hypothetical protein